MLTALAASESFIALVDSFLVFFSGIELFGLNTFLREADVDVGCMGKERLQDLLDDEDL